MVRRTTQSPIESHAMCVAEGDTAGAAAGGELTRARRALTLSQAVRCYAQRRSDGEDELVAQARSLANDPIAHL